MAPHEALKKWIEDQDGLTSAEFARRVGYDRSNFHRILTGGSKPPLPLAVEIEKQTDGAVKVEGWFPVLRERAA